MCSWAVKKNSHRFGCFVEIKRHKQIKADIVDEVREKIAKIRRPRRISVRKAIVFDGELAPAIRRTGYFDALVDIGELVR